MRAIFLIRTCHISDMTKRAVGWVLLVIAGLNFVAIAVRVFQDDPAGSPIYLILIVMMFIGGLGLIGKDKSDTPGAGVQKDDQ